MDVPWCWELANHSQLAPSPGGSLELFTYGGGVHPIIIGKELLGDPILIGS